MSSMGWAHRPSTVIVMTGSDSLGNCGVGCGTLGEPGTVLWALWLNLEGSNC
jgi:hypothetical protein